MTSLVHSRLQNPVAGSQVVRDGEDIERMLAVFETLVIPFSGEECSGRYLDLHQHYNKYVNSEFGKRISYIEYLGKFHAVFDEDMIPARLKSKSKREYQEYVAGLLEYLVSFMDRAHPLIFLDRVFKDLETELEERWTKKRPREGVSVSFDGFELDQYDTVEGLMGLGAEKLKEVLDSLGLKSGGTLQQRAERVFLAKDTNLEDMSRKHFRNDKKQGKVKETAFVEAKVKKLCELLKETIERTREHVMNRQGMSSWERKLEDEDYEGLSRDDEGNHEEEEEEEAVSNPLKLPLGFDGKPIPYWLYKLHGLGQKFNCEICGDYTYCGRREFEMHFKESRHQHGMRCLGIPNIKSFHEITSIEEVRKLWEEIKQRRQSSKWQPEVYEEFEDSEGNVYNKKTYTDLARQGLI